MILPAYISFMLSTPLFSDIEYSEAEALLDCLEADIAFFSKGDVILAPSTTNEFCCVLLSGQAKQLRLFRTDSFDGELQRTIEPGDLLGAEFAALNARIAGIAVIAEMPCVVLRFLYTAVPAFCSKACTSHKLMIDNLYRIIYSENRRLSQHNEVLSKRSIREKILEYLMIQQGMAGESSFSIPLNREELSEHLGIDRSALSRELSNMQVDGMITFNRSMFTLHNNRE